MFISSVPLSSSRVGLDNEAENKCILNIEKDQGLIKNHRNCFGSPSNYRLEHFIIQLTLLNLLDAVDLHRYSPQLIRSTGVNCI